MRSSQLQRTEKEGRKQASTRPSFLPGNPIGRHRKERKGGMEGEGRQAALKKQNLHRGVGKNACGGLVVRGEMKDAR